MALRYTIEEFSREISLLEYMARFHRPDEVWGYCRECSNYGRQWGCPPFDFDVVAVLSKYRNVNLFATKICLLDRELSSNDIDKILRYERIRLEQRLLKLERTHHGLACTFIGKCLHCGGACCARLSGAPCRHPELVRPSLEAYGFDVAKSLSELFDITLQWSTNGALPNYITLACALFYNAEE